MKTILSLIAACILFSITGCANAPQFKMSPELGAASVRVSVTVGAGLVLNKNPKYIPVTEALANGISAAISTSAVITPGLIAQYVTQVCEKYKVSSDDVGLFITLATTIYDTYVATYKPTVISSTDPNVLLYVNAFRDGLLAAAAIASSKSS